MSTLAVMHCRYMHSNATLLYRIVRNVICLLKASFQDGVLLFIMLCNVRSDVCRLHHSFLISEESQQNDGIHNYSLRKCSIH